jgi:hypothetical protein
MGMFKGSHLRVPFVKGIGFPCPWDQFILIQRKRGKNGRVLWDFLDSPSR